MHLLFIPLCSHFDKLWEIVNITDQINYVSIYYLLVSCKHIFLQDDYRKLPKTISCQSGGKTTPKQVGFNTFSLKRLTGRQKRQKYEGTIWIQKLDVCVLEGFQFGIFIISCLYFSRLELSLEKLLWWLKGLTKCYI